MRLAFDPLFQSAASSSLDDIGALLTAYWTDSPFAISLPAEISIAVSLAPAGPGALAIRMDPPVIPVCIDRHEALIGPLYAPRQPYVSVCPECLDYWLDMNFYDRHARVRRGACRGDAPPARRGHHASGGPAADGRDADPRAGDQARRRARQSSCGVPAPRLPALRCGRAELRRRRADRRGEAAKEGPSPPRPLQSLDRHRQPDGVDRRAGGWLVSRHGHLDVAASRERRTRIPAAAAIVRPRPVRLSTRVRAALAKPWSVTA